MKSATQSAAVSGDGTPPSGEESRLHCGCTLAAYATMKCLPTRFLEELGVSDMVDHGVPVLRISYRDDAGREAAVRIRAALEKSPERDDRFRWETGFSSLFGAHRSTPLRVASSLRA
jgi:hypothetical protein